MSKVRGRALDLSVSERDPEHTLVVYDKRASNSRM